MVWGTRGENMKITIDGANLKDLNVFLYERVQFDPQIYGASRVFKNCHTGLNLIYKKFIRVIEIAETLIIHPTEGLYI